MSGFLKNFLSIGFAGAAQQAAMLLVGFLVARSMGVETFGDYSAALVFSGLCLIFVDVGMNLSLLKNVAKEREGSSAYLGNALLMTAVIAAVAFPAMIWVAGRIGYSAEVRSLIALLGAVMVFTGFQNTFASLFQAKERMTTIAAFRLAGAAAGVAAVAAVVHNGGSLHGALWALAAVNAVLTAAWLGCALRTCRPTVDLARLPGMLKESYLYALMSVFYFVYFRVDTLVLSLVRPAAEVGLYNAAYQLIIVFVKLNIVVSFVTLPTLFKIEGDGARLQDAYLKQVRVMGLLGLAVFAGLASFSDDLMGLLYGPGFAGSARLLSILAVVVFFKYVALAPGNLLTVIDKQAWRTAVCGAVAVLNMGLNLWLIPLHGAYGAAWATVLSDLALVVASFAVAHVGRPHPRVVSCAGKLAAAGAAAGLVVFVGGHWLPSWGVFVGGAAAAAAAAAALGVHRAQRAVKA